MPLTRCVGELETERRAFIRGLVVWSLLLQQHSLISVTSLCDGVTVRKPGEGHRPFPELPFLFALNVHEVF